MTEDALAHAHSNGHVEHYTPAWLAEKARAVLGAIDYDPMSCAAANEVIRAQHWSDADALRPQSDPRGHFPWFRLSGPDGAGEGAPARVWLNPAGGKLDRKTLEPLPRNQNGIQGGPGISAAAAAWAKLSHEWAIGNVHSALFLCFSMGVFRTAQDPDLRKFFPRCTDPTLYPFVVFRERIAFDVLIDTVTTNGDWIKLRQPGESPPQDSALVYLPPNDNAGHGLSSKSRFLQEFRQLGTVRL